MKILQWAAVAAMVLAMAVLGAGRLGLFSGRPPTRLGVHYGQLAPMSATPNSVSSQADLYPGHPQQAYARIAPLGYSGDAASAMQRLAQQIRRMPGATVVTADATYLYVQFRTPWLGFVDDAEFWLDPPRQVIQVRSASRLGRSDFGVNRRRIETIRAALAR